MRKQMIQEAAGQVANQIRAVEDSIEAALAEFAELQLKMLNARLVTNAGFAASHAAFEPLAVTANGLIAARGGIANCHSALVDASQAIPGLRAVGFGDGDQCPPAKGAADLHIVA